MVKKLPAMQEAQLQSLGGRSPGEGNGYPLQCSCLENPLDSGILAGYSPWGCKESDSSFNYEDRFKSRHHLLNPGVQIHPTALKSLQGGTQCHSPLSSCHQLLGETE